MKKFFIINKIKIFFLIFIILGLIIRLLYLNSFPVWIGDEELELVINAKSIFLTGSNIDRSWSPFNSSMFQNIIPPVPYLFLTPLVGFFPFSLFFAKISSVFLHILLIILVYLLVKKIIGKYEAYTSLIVGLISPWSFFFSRTNFEAPISVFFYLGAWTILAYASGYRMLLACIPMILAFNSYTGMKLILIPFSFSIAYYSWKYIHHKKFTLSFLLFSIFCALLFLFQLLFFKSQAISQRVNELALPNSPVIVNIIGTERQLSISNPFISHFSNKIITYPKYIIGKYFEVFSFHLLFFKGEHRATYSLYTHGDFYYLDIFFIFIGIFYIYKIKRPAFYLLIFLLFISASPAVVSTLPTGFISLRAALLFPILWVFIGNGIYAFVKINNSKINIPKVMTISFIYFALFIHLSYIYFLRYPIYASEAFGFSKKILTTYISLSNETSDELITIYVKSPKDIFQHYIFKENLLNKDSSNTISEIINKDIIEYKNIRIINCMKEQLPETKGIIVIESGVCEKYLSLPIDKPYISIIQLSDAGNIYKIYDDRLCSNENLKLFSDIISFKTIEDGYKNKSIFCQNFIFTH
jgi:4-amino-4-deoxy-L-arabinose transferase-like glycosyltransferase